MEQLLWLETLIKGGVGACLLISPKLLIQLFALPETQKSFWPRLTGTLLVAIAAVTFLSGAQIMTDGIGLGGLAILNLSAAAILFAHYLRPNGTPRRRGRALLGALALFLAILGGLELVFR